MAGRRYSDFAYAQLRRWDLLNDRWVDHFRQDALVEVILSRDRTFLVCGTQHAPQSFQCPIDDANITRTSNDVFEIAASQITLQLYFRSTSDANIFQRSLGNVPFRDSRGPQPPQGQFDRGGPFQPQGRQAYNQPSVGDFNRRDQFNQQGHPQQFGGQDQPWGQQQMGGPGARDVNQYSGHSHYQNTQQGGGGGARYGDGQFYGGGAQHGGSQYTQNRDPYDGGRAQYGGGDPYGRNQGSYDDKAQTNNQPPGMDQRQYGGPQYGGQQAAPPSRGVQEIPNRRAEAWTSESQPVDLNRSTADLAAAINYGNLELAYSIIDRLSKLQKTERVFNVQLDYYGDTAVKSPDEEMAAKEEEMKKFRLKVAIERQCAPNENAIDIIIKAKEDDTIEQLENLFESQYNIPGEVQRWIIKQQLASDRSKSPLKEFGVTKEGGLEQEVYLFVIQGMKERMKSDFFNKRLQQVQDDQRQQQQIAQDENRRKQMGLSNRQEPESMRPPQQQQYQQSYNSQNQADQRPPQMSLQNAGPGFYQDQQPMHAGAQQPYRPQQQQIPPQQIPPQHQQPPVQPRNDFQDSRFEYQEPQRSHQPMHQPEIPPPNQPPAVRNNPPRGAAGGVAVFPVVLQNVMHANVEPPPRPIDVGQPEKPEGWNCAVCTFLNEPYRPGCKVCSADRPEGYEPPPNYIPSDDEKRFLNI